MNALGVAPVFQVSDVDAGLKYYRDVLGFNEDFRFGQYAAVCRDSVTLHLCGHTVHQRPVGGGAVAIFCDKVDAYFAALQANGARIKVEVGDRPYGMRDFTVLDPDGNYLTFGCESKEQ